MKCPNCEFINIDGARFCNNCGCALNSQFDNGETDISSYYTQRQNVESQKNNYAVRNQPQKKSNKLKVWLIILIVLGALLTLSAFMSLSGINSSKKSQTSESESEITDTSKIVYDKNGIQITYKGIENSYGITTSLKFLIENNNSTKYTVQTADVTIDGFTYSTIMSASIAANKKTSDSIVIMDSDFEENGTSYDKIKTAEIDLTIWSDSNMLEHIKDTITFTIQ